MIYLKHDFNPVHTFECGQCFRWNSTGEENEYIGVAGGRVCRVKEGEVYCSDEDNGFWENYFCTDIDYGGIKNLIGNNDPKLKKCIDFGGGIRLLRQDVWETIISFIISANNNIPRIKKIIETMCSEFGEKIKPQDENLNDTDYYTFPTAEKLNSLDISDLACLRAGYRDKYIMDAASKVAGGEVDLSALPDMPTVDAKKELMKIKGVGGKVADCILLFSLSRWELFPKDVWIKRILNEVYSVPEKEIDGFITDKYGDYAGFAQQYMYYYYRENNI